MILNKYSLLRKVGDELDTHFWYDRWLEDTPLCVWFMRLFDLVENKSSSVVTIFFLG